MLTKLKKYLLQEYILIDDPKYYLKLSVIIGVILTIFVYIFDPYDNYHAIPNYDIPIKIIQLGYGIITTIVIYALHWLLFRKLGFANGKQPWKTYHHWLLLVAILCIAGFLGTVYHRFMMNVGEVATDYYVFVTIPRSVFIAIPLFVITILLDQLYVYKERQNNNLPTASSVQKKAEKKTTSPEKIILSSPIIKQNIEVDTSKILYIKASGNYVEIYTEEIKKTQLFRASLSYVAECLQSYDFIKKCHRKYFVNIKKVKNYQGNSKRLLLDIAYANEQIPVSKSYVKQILPQVKNKDKNA